MCESSVPSAGQGGPTDDALECVPVDRLATLVGVSKSQLYTLARQGKVPCARLGGNVVFPRRQWEQWFAEVARVKDEKLTRVDGVEAGLRSSHRRSRRG